MTTIENTIKEYILSRIFSEFPTTDTDTFDFFMISDIDATVTVGETPLRDEWGYEVCEEYEWENVRSLRGLMQSELNDLMRLQSTIMNKCTSIVQINKDEIISDSVFEELSQVQNANIHRAGTNDEFITFNTINLGDM